MGSRRVRIAAFALALAFTAAVGVTSPAAADKPSEEAAETRIAHMTEVTTQSARGNRLNSGQSISMDDYLQSANGQHQLWVNQGVYVFSGSGGVEFVVGEDEVPAGFQTLIMQDDGNLVLYVDGTPAFNTGTGGNPDAYAVMQDDGNVVVYSMTGRPLWASGTMAYFGWALTDEAGEAINAYLRPGWYLVSTNGRYKLLMQGDGNLVLYSGTRPLWHAGTHGNSGAYLVIQGDGNLVVYSATGRPLWNSATVRRVNFVELRLQNDANLVLYGWTGNRAQVLWHSHTAGRG